MPAKLTQEQFINKANSKHDNYYDYSLVNYTKAQTKVKIICPKHGEFEQQPNNHLFGQGCVWCMGDNVRSARTLSHYQFISKLKGMQPDLYDELIFKEEYVKNYDKIILGTKYGDVKISPNLLLRGVYPCISNAVNPKEYILNYIKINNPKLYDNIIEISGNYNGVMSKINIKTIYGVVNITPDSIFQGSGFDIRSAIDRNEYFLNYIKINHPKYIDKDFKLISNVKGNKDLIEFSLSSGNYITTLDSLMNGYFSDESPKGIFNIATMKRNKNVFLKTPCYIYKIRLFNNSESFYKIGIITKDIKVRFRSFPYKYEVLEIISINLYDAYVIEQEIHNHLKEYKYTPQIKFGGYTECFTKIDLKQDIL
jgi:hypothetical protein